MKAPIKITFGLVGGLLVLLVLTAVLLPIIYDTEDIKESISAQVKAQTGRDLLIEGPLDFSVFPWIAVEVGQLSLSNAEGFGEKPFAQIDRARVGVALMPLFKKQLIADEVTLEGLQLDLAVKPNGVNNWDDLSSTDQADDAAASDQGSLFSSQQIAGLNIRESNIEYQDQQAGTHYRLRDLSIQTGALGGSGPVPLTLSLLLDDLIAATSHELSLSASSPFNLSDEVYILDQLELSLANQSGNDEPMVLRAPNLAANLASQTLDLDSFTANMGGLEASGQINARQILGDLVFDGNINIAEFSPRNFMNAMAMEPPNTTDPEALRSAAFSSALSGSDSHIAFDGIKLLLDQSQFIGDLHVQNFENPAIRFEFDVDSINIDRYLEPAEETSETDIAMPSDEIKGIDLQGKLRVSQLSIAGLDLNDAIVGLNISNGKLKLHPLKAGFYDGQYNGNISLDSSGSTPVLTLDEKLDSITFKRLMSDLTDNENLSGTGQAHVRLTGQGKTSNEVMRSLNGELGLTLDEGALEGINIWYEIRRAYALYKGLDAPEHEADRTVFSRMQFDAAVSEGLLTTRKLVADLPFLAIRGNGIVDLGESNIDLQLTATVRDVPELSQDELGNELKGKQLPFKVSGAMDDPKISIDWAKLLQGEAADMLLDKLGLGSDSESENPDGETESSKDQGKKAAKGLLFDLLGGKKEKKDESDEG